MMLKKSRVDGKWEVALGHQPGKEFTVNLQSHRQTWRTMDEARGGTGVEEPQASSRQPGLIIRPLVDRQPARRSSARTSSSAPASCPARRLYSPASRSYFFLRTWNSSAILSAASTARRKESTVEVCSATVRILPSTNCASRLM